jgi:multiple sugar transport system substrate-binding protein
VPEWERIATAVGRAGDAVVRDAMDVEPALVRLDAEADAILEKRRWLLAQEPS